MWRFFFSCCCSVYSSLWNLSNKLSKSLLLIDCVYLYTRGGSIGNRKSLLSICCSHIPFAKFAFFWCLFVFFFLGYSTRLFYLSTLNAAAPLFSIVFRTRCVTLWADLFHQIEKKGIIHMPFFEVNVFCSHPMKHCAK